MDKILIVQPHSDDALFSCAHVLFNKDYDVEVLTVENNPKRVAEDEELYSFLNVPYYHLNVEFDDQSYYEYFKKFKDVTSDDTRKFFVERFGRQKVDEIRTELRNWITGWLKRKEYMVLAPWGVGHPFHALVRDVVQNWFCGDNVAYYRDFPHSYHKRSKAQLAKQEQEYTLLRSVPVEEFADVKWKLAREFYKSQAVMIYYERLYVKKKLPEEVYTYNDGLPF